MAPSVEVYAGTSKEGLGAAGKESLLAREFLVLGISMFLLGSL